MTAGSNVTVLIAHGDPLLSAGLEAAFRSRAQFEVVDGSNLPNANVADVIVADFDNGVTLASERGAPPVMIISHEDGESPIRKALECGVRGYLLADSPIESIINGARILVSGGIVIDPFAASQMLNSLNAEQLTKRELDVLNLLARGFTDKKIASRLGLAVGTIKCHLKHVRSKLEASSRTEVILIAQRRGLLLSNPFVAGHPRVARRRHHFPRAQQIRSIL
jgi:DNA-binding NarL/FixJ family response regulator